MSFNKVRAILLWAAMVTALSASSGIAFASNTWG
jgi:hypothetical protein